MFGSLREPKPGIDDDRLAGHASIDCANDGRVELARDLRRDIRVVGLAVHLTRSAAIVRQHEGYTP